MASAFFYLTLVLFLLVCLILILLVLIQKGRGGGLASAFGGGGGNTAFGSKTGDVLTWATSVVFGVFLLLAVILNLLANASNPAVAAPIAPPAAANATSENPIGSANGTTPPGGVLPRTEEGTIALPSATPAGAPPAAPTTQQTASPGQAAPAEAVTAPQLPPAAPAAPTTGPSVP
jgi:preprotein translocase subunit SecG